MTLVVEGWGNNGSTTLAWVVASWFVNQIKAKIGFFPFLSLYGDPAAGKSALTVILNAMQGIDGEGLPLSQLNTKKAMARSISRVSGLFTALLEDNQRNERAFDYSILLTGYNQGPLQLKAAFSNDNRVNESPFQGALMFIQNTEPFNQKAEKQRVISLHFELSSLSTATRTAYEKLISLSNPVIARLQQATLKHRKVFEEKWMDFYNIAIEDLGTMDNRRILQNHALVLSFHRIFCEINKIDHNLTNFLRQAAITKCQTSAIQEYSLATYFFERIDQLDNEKLDTCMHMDRQKSLIYINLPGIEQLLRNQGLQFSVNNVLTQELTQHPAFLENSKRFRFPCDPEKDSKGRPRQRRSWVFDANKFET